MAIPTVSQKERRRVNKKVHQTHTIKNSTKLRTALRERTYWLFMVGIILVVLFLLVLVSVYDLPIKLPELVPFSLHSVLVADYSADPKSALIPALQIDLIRDVINDLGTPNPQDLFSSFQLGLLTPVPTVTPLYTAEGTQFSSTNTLFPTPINSTPTQSRPGQTLPPTSTTPPTPNTQFTPTSTLQPAVSPTKSVSTPTSTQPSIPTNTPPQITSLPPTHTQVPPSSTPIPTQIAPTATQPPPTNTPLPPTAPPPPPTATPQPTNTPNPYPYP